MKKLFSVFLGLFLITVISCASASFAGSIDELSGFWIAEDGSGYEYPYSCDGKIYLRKFCSWQDCTRNYVSYADERGISLEATYSLRFCLESEDFPKTYSNGIEEGFVYKKTEDAVYKRKEYLFPESVFYSNLNFFKIQKSKEKIFLKEENVFHFYDEGGKILRAQDLIFKKEKNE